MLDETIELYEKELTLLEDISDAVEAQILRVLIARDQVHLELTKATPISAEKLLKIIELDTRLKEQATRINQLVQLAQWRTCLNVSTEHWWWFIESPKHQLDALDWLWNGLTVISLTASVSLVIDISTRFLSGGPGLVGSFAVITQSLLTLLTAGSVLTEAGRKGVEEVISKFGVKTYLWQETKFGLSALLLLGLIGFKAALPGISNYLNQEGWKNYITSQWDNAISDYERAISLDPDNAEAHRNLGLIYENLQDLEKAQTEYRLAIQGNLSVAYNSLARLYLLKKKPTEAVSLLQQSRNNLPKEDKLVNYNWYKNFAWSRFQQERYDDATVYLEQAIAIQETLPSNYDKDGAANCLLAQIFEKNNTQKKRNTQWLEKANTQWNVCSRIGNNRLPEVDEWKAKADQILKLRGK
ncbi:tetratricopeptide repeat protein [Nostoc sp. UHCC 0302]|uniref:tetratricopeptide repeat protein n=1 Tax=Nostoc sp. UHCC 0302 TaxID=3134896 RepID=UPI00311CAAAC